MRGATGSRLALSLFLLVSGAAGLAAAVDTTGAALTREQKPAYPEGLQKLQKQGNVLLIGRIDKTGRVQDAQAVAASDLGFVDSSLAAVKAWQFKPATSGGRPIDVAVNIGIRFRLEGKKRGEIPRPALGDLAVFPADAAGRKTAPDGFPIRRGGDARIRVEAVLDLAPVEGARRIPVRAEAVSPRNRRIVLSDATIAVPSKAPSAAIPFTAVIGNDWEDGIWQVQFSIAGVPAGGGQFWLAADPERFDFAGAMARSAAAAKAPLPAPGSARRAAAPPSPAAAGAKRTPAASGRSK